MSRVWVSRMMGGAASVALAAAVLAAPLAASPPECTKGSCPTSITGKIVNTIPGLARLLRGEGSACEPACQTAVFELVQTAEGFKLQPVEADTCTTAKNCQDETAPTFSPVESFVAAKIACGTCDKAKCSTAACSKTACNASACKDGVCSTSACSKTACAKTACKEISQKVCAKVASVVSTCAKASCAVSTCSKGECAKTCATQCSTAKCATAACAKGECAASCKAACATAACAKTAVCSKGECSKTCASTCAKVAVCQKACDKTACSKAACVSTCSQNVCAKGECAKTCATACKSAACAKAVCAKACSATTACKCDATAKCCAACKCDQGTSDKLTACETDACGKQCGVIDIKRCEVTGDATLSQLWQMASAHCPVFNGQGGDKPAMVPAAVAQLEAKIAALETKLETYESVTEQREALYETLIHIQKEASDNKAAMTELVFTAMFQALEAKAQAAEENLAEYRRIIEEAAEVHVTNATLQAKLEAAEAKLELVHTLARLQLENDRLKQQIAAKTSQGEAFTSNTCPVTTTAAPKTIGTCTTGTCTTGTCTTTTCNGTQPQILPVPPTRLTASTTAAPQQFAVHIRLYQETADQATKQLAAPVILTAAGRKFSLISGGVIQAGGTDTQLPLGTQVEGRLGKCTSEGVELELAIQHCVQVSGTTQAATVVSQCGGQIAGCIPLGKPVSCTLSQSNGQPVCVEIKIEPACAPEVAEQR